MKKIKEAVICLSLLLFSLLLIGSVQANNEVENKIIYSVIGIGGNSKEALKNAYNKLSQQIISDHLLTENSAFSNIRFEINNDRQFALPKILPFKSLGRTKDGEFARVKLLFENETYITILRTLIIRLQTLVNFDREWETKSLEDIKEIISTLKILLDLNIDKISSIQIDYSNKLKKIDQKINKTLNKGEVQFLGETKGASIYINGKTIGSNKTIFLIPGKHLFEIVKDDYFNLSGSVYLNPGEKRSIWVHLVKEPIKQINIKLNLSKNLLTYKNYLKKTLATLGYSLDFNLKEAFSINVDLLEEASQFQRESLTFTTMLYSVNINISELKNNQKLLGSTWSQSFTSPTLSDNNKSYIEDLLRRALYNFYQKVNRGYITGSKSQY